MKKSIKITRRERFDIRILLDLEQTFRAIARKLNRSPNSIRNEVVFNSVSGVYDPIKADAKAKTRRRSTRLKWSKIENNPALKKHIIAKLKKHWNPDEISGNMRECHLPFYASKTAIYQWLFSCWGQRYCRYLYSKRYRRKKRKFKIKKTTVIGLIPIQMRPDEINLRLESGHWEGDAIVSCKSGKGGAAVAQERKSKLICAKIVRTLKPKPYVIKLKRMLNGKKALSITFDRGIENRNHLELCLPAYGCDPYSSWQKGGVENGNKMIRRYFPKGADFSKIRQKQMDRIVSIINNKPRRSLGYKSALAVARAEGVLVN